MPRKDFSQIAFDVVQQAIGAKKPKPPTEVKKTAVKRPLTRKTKIDTKRQDG